MSRRVRRTRALRAGLAAAMFALTGCSSLPLAQLDQTPYGVQLRERVEEWDRWCQEEKLGPYNSDPRRAHITTCDFLYLKDKHWDPNATEESRFAHSIRLPPPHDKPQDVYRPGMSSKEYLDELCAKEAGQWVFRTVEGVEGVLQARPFVALPRGYHAYVHFSAERFPLGSNFDLQWLSVAPQGTFIEYK